MSRQNGAVERLVQSVLRTGFQKYVLSDDTERMAEASKRERQVKDQKLASIASDTSNRSTTTAELPDQTAASTDAIEELIAE